MRRDIQREIRFRGTEMSPAFMRAPSNGCAERVIRTLKAPPSGSVGGGTTDDLRQTLPEVPRTTTRTG